jgi:hypothetical protein
MSGHAVRHCGTAIAIMITVMTLSETLIIYAACGAPFAIYRITSESVHTLKGLMVGLLAGIFWPLVLVNVIYQTLIRASANIDRSESSFERLMDQFVDSFGLGPVERRGFRDDVDRYMNLAAIASIPDDEMPSAANEFFSLAGHPNAELADACYRRKTSRILDHHAERAYRTVDTRMQRTNLSGEVREQAVGILREMSSLIGNERLARDLDGETSTEVFTPTVPEESNSRTEQAVWKARSTTIIQ